MPWYMITFRNVRTYLERRHILHYQRVVFGIYTKEPKTKGAQSAPAITAHPRFCSAVRVYIHFCVAKRPRRYHMLSVTPQLHSNVTLLSNQRQGSHLFSMTYNLNFPAVTDIINLSSVESYRKTPGTLCSSGLASKRRSPLPPSCLADLWPRLPTHAQSFYLLIGTPWLSLRIQWHIISFYFLLFPF